MKTHFCLLLFVIFYGGIYTQAQPAHTNLSNTSFHLAGQALTSPVFAPDPDDIFWDNRFTIGGPNWGVSSMVFDENGDLYVGGAFSTAGNQLGANVARWDGSVWNAVGEGLQGVVSCLIIDESGTLFTGGWNLIDSGSEDDILATFDGDSWLPLWTTQWLGNIDAMIMDSEGSIYGGGYVYTVQDNRSHHIVKWDRTVWSALGGKISGGRVNDIVVDEQGNVFIVGGFDSIGGDSVKYVSMWDGASWTTLGEGIEEGLVSSLVMDNSGNLYVGGNFTLTGDASIRNVAKWDGEAWSSIRDGLDDEVSVLTFDGNGNLHASIERFNAITRESSSYINKWNGSTWSSIGDTLDNKVHALAIDRAGNIYLGGSQLMKDEAASNVVMWDGSTWLAVSEGGGLGLNSGTSTIVADEDGGFYVGGGFSIAGDVVANKVARWDGESWAPLGVFIGNRVLDLAQDEDGNLYAGGEFEIFGGAQTSGILLWDGESWAPLPRPLGREEADRLWVRSIVFDEDGYLYAGGEFETADGKPAKNVAVWDGASWSALGEGVEGNYAEIYVLALDGNGNLFVGGDFDMAGGAPAKNIAMWNGSSWSEVGGGLYDGSGGGSVNALKFDAGTLYAGGHFTKAGNKQISPHIASWDGNTWKGLGIGFNNTVLSLLIGENEDVYAGGNFSALGSSASQGGFSHIARWDGTDWQRLGSGVQGKVREMILDEQGFLFVAGSFSVAGNKPSNGFARWDTRSAALATSVELPNELPQTGILTAVYPNPFRHHATLELTVRDPQVVKASLYDASGRFIKQLLSGPSSAGQIHQIQIDSYELASGTYFVRINGKSFSQIRAVTLLK